MGKAKKAKTLGGKADKLAPKEADAPVSSKVAKGAAGKGGRPKIHARRATDSPKKSASTEIDELFSGVGKRTTLPLPLKLEPKQPRPQADQADDGFADTRGVRNRARPLTADGLPIFTTEEMRIGRGGDTPDCPFDCACCH